MFNFLKNSVYARYNFVFASFILLFSLNANSQVDQTNSQYDFESLTPQSINPNIPLGMFNTENERCIIPASYFHGVNYYILRAILKVESGLNPRAIGKNKNGTIDIGMGQLNSIHLNELSKFGIQPNHLMDACTSTYISAWFLKKNIIKHGNTWEAIARYHSATPLYNMKYQVLIINELIKSGTANLQ